jgi:hypothetical protein
LELNSTFTEKGERARRYEKETDRQRKKECPRIRKTEIR